MLLAGIAFELGARFEPVLRRAGLVLGVAALALVVVRSLEFSLFRTGLAACGVSRRP